MSIFILVSGNAGNLLSRTPLVSLARGFTRAGERDVLGNLENLVNSQRKEM